MLGYDREIYGHMYLRVCAAESNPPEINLHWSSEDIHNVEISLVFIATLGQTIAEGNSNPLQYSCLENPMDGEAW